MHNISHRDYSCILNILETIKKIQNYSNPFKNADDLYENTISFDATMMNFIVIGEMAEKLSEQFIEETKSEINWLKIKGFRNIIAHNYFGIDAEEVWQIIQTSLVSLKETLDKKI
jgi:uncharacterized protein with HEPN domain